ncbi:MAG: YggU family protein [Gammaproteobacteria bacterium]|nr:YggU family protein [Gammaproteobacteria bacterium]
MGWFRRDGADLILQVQVQPRAKSDAIAGVIGDRLKVRLTAPPVEGRANEHLVAYLAKLFDVPRRHVVLERGETSKRKQLRILSPQKLPENLDWGVK